jgi:N-acetylmuramoyl-L-alanine amidase
MPSILIETAFVSNPDDMAVLQDEDKIEEIGEAIADGIIQAIAKLE